MKPTVSIILPTYNRARFLPSAFESIRAQSFTDWELIVVDDGSTDETPELVRHFAGTVPQKTEYVYQANAGPYGARNTGLDHARGKYVAFFDSDDVWLSHHLQDCVRELEAHAQVAWVYGACRIVDDSSGAVLLPSTFESNGTPVPFVKLHNDQHGALHIIDDVRTVRCAILHGLGCGLQNSVIRRDWFTNYRFRIADRNEAEDQLVAVEALLSGCRFGYLDNVHVIYRIHGSNSSGSAKNMSPEKQVELREKLIRGFEGIRRERNLSWLERRTLDRRLSLEYFWKLGYALFWRDRRRREALRMFHKGLALWPWDMTYWKTYFLVWARIGAGL